MHSHACFFLYFIYGLFAINYLFVYYIILYLLYYIIYDDQQKSEDIHRLTHLEHHPVSAVSNCCTPTAEVFV